MAHTSRWKTRDKCVFLSHFRFKNHHHPLLFILHWNHRSQISTLPVPNACVCRCRCHIHSISNLKLSLHSSNGRTTIRTTTTIIFMWIRVTCRWNELLDLIQNMYIYTLSNSIFNQIYVNDSNSRRDVIKKIKII